MAVIKEAFLWVVCKYSTLSSSSLSSPRTKSRSLRKELFMYFFTATIFGFMYNITNYHNIIYMKNPHSIEKLFSTLTTNLHRSEAHYISREEKVLIVYIVPRNNIYR